MKLLSLLIKALVANREQQARAYRQGYSYYY
jgi:hypothetical protein